MEKQKMSVEEIISFINEWIERERKYELKAEKAQDMALASDCHRRIFTLQLLLSNIA